VKSELNLNELKLCWHIQGNEFLLNFTGNSNGTLHKRGPNTWIRNERGDEGLGHSIQTYVNIVVGRIALFCWKVA